ncbi:8-oxo-dGTP diphosphatase MutT [cyanobiont of Ornithocercus magnificus]|nr:8-oxo-dGTP diphosphatase MutT [cyanobiont of Ornithocercus magnificus]
MAFSMLVDNPGKDYMSHSIGVGIILNKHGHVLIAQRLPRDSLGDLWEFPGGKQVPGETIEECIARELREEVGLEVKVGKQLISLDHTYGYRQLSFSVHLCNHIGGEAKPLVSQQVRWVKVGSLLLYPFPAASIHMINALHIYLKSNKEGSNKFT